MKKIRFILLIAMAFALKAHSQSDPNAKYFLQMNSGKMVYTDRMTLEEPFLRGSYLLVDGTEKYKLSEVKWYRSPDGTFKRFSKGVFDNNWYKQEEEGKINVYSRIVTTSNGGSGWNRGIYYAPTYSTTKVEYYQIGDKPPAAIRYEPLKNIMKGHDASLSILNKGHQRAITRGVLYGVGAVALLAGTLLTINNSETDPFTGLTTTRISPLVYVGAVTCIVPIFIPSPTRDYRRAITIFNVK